MCNQPDQSLIGQCEHKITKGFLSHRIMWRSWALYMSICSFNPMCQIISKHLEVNFKNLLGMKYVPDVVFLVLWSENNDWTIYVFAAGVGCKIRSVGSTEFRNIPYLSSRATCTINVMVIETLLLRLKIWILSFLEEAIFGSTFNNYFNVFHVNLFSKNLDLILATLLTHIFSWIVFPRSFICKNLDVN